MRLKMVNSKDVVRIRNKILDYYKRPEYFFLSVASVIGVFFIFVFPPFQVIDEGSHFLRAYHIAEGGIFGIKYDDERSGGELPTAVIDAPEGYAYMSGHYNQKGDTAQVFDDVFGSSNTEARSEGVFNNTVIYPPLTYLPQVIGIKLGMVFNAPVVVDMYLARLASLVFWLAAIFWSIRLIPIGKWALAIIALLPMLLTQAASVSSDATINALTIFTTSIITLLIVKKQQNTKALLWILVVCTVFLALVKLPSVAIMLLAAVIPVDRFGSLKNKIIYLGALAGFATVLIILWNLFAFTIKVDLLPWASSSEQIYSIISNPLYFMKLFLFYPLQSEFDQTILQTYGWLGWNEIKLPLWLALIHFGCITLALMDPLYKKIKITRSMRFYTLSVGVLCAVAITTLIYLTWMPVGFGHFYDLWGRYYVALLPIVILGLGGLVTLDVVSWNKVRKYIIAVTPVSLLVVIFLVWSRYYAHMPLG